MRSATVVGAGVSGLTTALSLIEDGWAVTVLTRDDPLDTVSAVAGAIWYPTRGERDAATADRIKTSFERFSELAADPLAGIAMVRGAELHREVHSDEWWRDVLPGFRSATTDELPAGFVGGWHAGPLPTIDMGLYLPWLVRAVRERGRIERADVGTLDQVEGDIVVNCSGLGAETLAGDRMLEPIRGQVVRVEHFGRDTYLLDEGHPDGIVYIIPRVRDVVLGGIREVGSDDTGIDRATARAIIERCADLDPRIRDARVVSEAAGLRPGRPAVRVEIDTAYRVPVIHNYGHAGGGVTLSWGCAADVVSLARTIADPDDESTRRPRARRG